MPTATRNARVEALRMQQEHARANPESLSECELTAAVAVLLQMQERAAQLHAALSDAIEYAGTPEGPRTRMAQVRGWLLRNPQLIGELAQLNTAVGVLTGDAWRE